MINTWFTADFHLGHQNIIRYCNRPFHSTSEMDEAILGNLNSLVRQDDVLYFLGDFCMGGPDQARRYRDRVVCRNIHVVEGNHDRALRHLTTEFCTRNQMAEIRVDAKGLCSVTTRCGSGIIRRVAVGTCTAIRTGNSLMLRHHYRWMLEWTLTSFCPGASTR
jgi:calcineurin-like phosphoesterase family protein